MANEPKAPILPIVKVVDEDGPIEATFPIPTPETPRQSIKLKLRNKCNRLMVFRVRYEGADLQRFRLQPTDIGVLSPLDTQPFELSVEHGVLNIGAERWFSIETAFVTPIAAPEQQPQQQPQPQRAVLDAVEIWRNVGNERVTKKKIPIRFDQTLNVTEERATVYVNVLDPTESIWVLNLKAWEIYGYARSQFPQEVSALLWFIFLFAAFWFVVGLVCGLKFG